MTSITKAENKLEELKKKSEKKMTDAIKSGIEAMTELIALFNYKKRKIEKKQLKDMYAWFEDEFNVLYEKCIG